MTFVNDSQAKVAGYQLLTPAIHGGSSAVYKARRLVGDSTPVALKILHPNHNSARISREANALRSLQHPHILRFVESGSLGEHPYLATQWVDGISLKQLMDDDVLTDERSLSVAVQLASALHYAHQHKVTHGDLSPSNVLISDNNQAVLLDFGMGRFTSESTITADGDLAGTPRYLAPELIKGESPSAASDQYALALVLYEMLTGDWPFGQQTDSTAAVLHHQLYSAPTPLREARPDCAGKLEKVLARALDKKPEKRFASIHAFSVELTAPVIKNESLFNMQKLSIGAAATMLCIGLASAGLSYVKPVQPHHVAHDTAPLCNMYSNADFRNELEQNFYRDQDNDLLARRIVHSGIDSSPVLQLGDIDIYGQYGVIIPIESGKSFNFSADLWFEGYVHRAHLRIVWLDTEWQSIKGADSEFEIAEKHNDRYVFRDISPPREAHYAVPTLFKDASGGIAFADNIHFSAANNTSAGC